MIFVDTSFFAALLLPKDAHHLRAAQAIEDLGQVRLSDVLLTTNNVVLETITVARYEGNHTVAQRAGELLYAGTMARLYRTTVEDEAAAFVYFRRHHDKEYHRGLLFRRRLLAPLRHAAWTEPEVTRAEFSRVDVLARVPARARRRGGLYRDAHAGRRRMGWCCPDRTPRDPRPRV